MKSKRTVFICTLWALMTVLLSCAREGTAPVVEGMAYIPPGEFIMGSEEKDAAGLGKEFGLRKGSFYEDEAPKQSVFLKGYYIDTYEVTNRGYKSFVDAIGHAPPVPWEGGEYPPGEDDHPVTNVTWYDAHAFCAWAGKRLPTEEEWEKAARGPDGNIYPWGNEFDKKKGNFFGTPAPVGSFETDRSYYGVYDMAGNVMEWVDSWYKAYPGNRADIKDYGEKHKVLRGNAASEDGHYGMTSVFARGSNRTYYLPGGAGFDGGFRCARDAEMKAR